MKYHEKLALIVAVSLACSTSGLLAQSTDAQNVSPWGTFAESPTVGGISVGVSTKRGTNDTKASDVLCWTVFATSRNQAPVRVPTDPAYAFQIELLDATGKEVPKTARGKSIGSKFSEFDVSFAGNHEMTRLVHPLQKADQMSWQILFAPPHFSARSPTPTPADLFEIPGPGTYTLRIRFQVIDFVWSGGQRQPMLLRFPPVDYRIVK